MTRAAYPILGFAELDSTNAEAMRRAVAGERGPLWIVADRQSAGRGRSGRTWASNDGNLFASLLLTLERAGPRAYQLSLVAGVALHAALGQQMPDATRPALRLKWPNDVLIGSAKVAGILVESSTRPGVPGLASVIGVGVNLTSHPVDLGRAATDLSAHGVTISARNLLDRVSIDLARWLEIWDEGTGFDAVREDWVAHGGAIGERLCVNTGAGGVLSGRYHGLDGDGALLLADDAGNVRRISYGDVTLTG